jgi:hypothetical protein
VTNPQSAAQDLARILLDRLRSARDEQVDPAGYAIDAIEMLPRLHDLTVDGGLPRSVDGRDFRAEAARLFDEAREPTRWAVALLAGRIGDARSHELYVALEQRSAVQYLADDFKGSVADGMVDDDSFDVDEDEYLAGKLREYGPFDFTVPRNVPPSHWWWSLAVGSNPS